MSNKPSKVNEIPTDGPFIIPINGFLKSINELTNDLEKQNDYILA